METDTADLRAQVTHLQEELASLRARYDTLLEAKNRAAERYKADYKKWRDFKRWLFRDVETDGHIRLSLKPGELDEYMKTSKLGKRKRLDDSGPNLDADVAEDHKRESIKAELSLSPRAAVVSGHQRRKSYHGEPSNKIHSPGDSKDPFLVQYSNRRNKSPVLNRKSELPCKAEPSQPVPLTEPRKGRGRYAQAPSVMATINSRFSIRRDRNDGMDFQYDAVVRNQQERRHMLGSDCECCREYYEAIAPLPASRQPLWATPTKRKPPYGDKENAEVIQEHKQQISRHRHHWHRPKTPPGYWDIGFPDTQEVLDINRRAGEMHRRKLIEVESEARNNNGRYVEHASSTS